MKVLEVFNNKHTTHMKLRKTVILNKIKTWLVKLLSKLDRVCTILKQ